MKIDFKIGDIVECIDDYNGDLRHHITIGNHYKIVEVSLDSIYIYDNNEEVYNFFKRRFKKVNSNESVNLPEWF